MSDTKVMPRRYYADKKPRMTELNPHLLCVLCGGYLIDATAIIECLHSFCKSCIVKYLATHTYCPICDVLVHKAKPLLNIRPDYILQNLVYKIVPGLYAKEMKIRRIFYSGWTTVQLTAACALPTPEQRGDISRISPKFLTGDDVIRLCLQFKGSPDRRYIRCEMKVSVSLLKKLLRFKYGDTPVENIIIYLENEPLPDNLTMIDVAYVASWSKKSKFPILLLFEILDDADNVNSASRTSGMVARREMEGFLQFKAVVPTGHKHQETLCSYWKKSEPNTITMFDKCIPSTSTASHTEDGPQNVAQKDKKKTVPGLHAIATILSLDSSGKAPEMKTISEVSKTVNAILSKKVVPKAPTFPLSEPNNAAAVAALNPAVFPGLVSTSAAIFLASSSSPSPGPSDLGCEEVLAKKSPKAVAKKVVLRSRKSHADSDLIESVVCNSISAKKFDGADEESVSSSLKKTEIISERPNTVLGSEEEVLIEAGLSNPSHPMAIDRTNEAILENPVANEGNATPADSKKSGISNLLKKSAGNSVANEGNAAVDLKEISKKLGSSNLLKKSTGNDAKASRKLAELDSTSAQISTEDNPKAANKSAEIDPKVATTVQKKSTKSSEMDMKIVAVSKKATEFEQKSSAVSAKKSSQVDSRNVENSNKSEMDSKNVTVSKKSVEMDTKASTISNKLEVDIKVVATAKRLAETDSKKKKSESCSRTLAVSEVMGGTNSKTVAASKAAEIVPKAVPFAKKLELPPMSTSKKSEMDGKACEISKNNAKVSATWKDGKASQNEPTTCKIDAKTSKDDAMASKIDAKAATILKIDSKSMAKNSAIVVAGKSATNLSPSVGKTPPISKNLTNSTVVGSKKSEMVPVKVVTVSSKSAVPSMKKPEILWNSTTTSPKNVITLKNASILSIKVPTTTTLSKPGGGTPVRMATTPAKKITYLALETIEKKAAEERKLKADAKSKVTFTIESIVGSDLKKKEEEQRKPDENLNYKRCVASEDGPVAKVLKTDAVKCYRNKRKDMVDGVRCGGDMAELEVKKKKTNSGEMTGFMINNILPPKEVPAEESGKSHACMAEGEKCDQADQQTGTKGKEAVVDKVADKEDAIKETADVADDKSAYEKMSEEEMANKEMVRSLDLDHVNLNPVKVSGSTDQKVEEVKETMVEQVPKLRTYSKSDIEKETKGKSVGKISSEVKEDPNGAVGDPELDSKTAFGMAEDAGEKLAEPVTNQKQKVEMKEMSPTKLEKRKR